jgi:hypothetical protein
MIYRVWNAVNRPEGVEVKEWHRRFISVDSPLEAYQVIEFLRSLQSSDVSAERSEFGLEYLCADGWKEWHDSGGLDVLERFGTGIRDPQPVHA